jgi:transcription initiation factor TFIIIB Brf1 subunit/transcription initiation factor TFIIB
MRCMLSCPYCKGMLVLQSHEYVCTRCGVVHDVEQAYYHKPLKTEDFYNSHNTPYDLTAFGLPATDHKPLKDIVTFKTLPASLATSKRRLPRQIAVITSLYTIRDRLGIPEFVIHEAYNLFNRYLKARCGKAVNSLKVVLSACVIIALKQHNHSRSFEELAKVLNINPRHIRSECNDIIKRLNLNFVYNSAEDTLSKIIADFNLEPKDVKEIRRIIDELKKITLKNGTAPPRRSITVAATYIYFKEQGLFKGRLYELEDYVASKPMRQLYYLYIMNKLNISDGGSK